MSCGGVGRKISLDDLRAAHERIRPYIHRTPILTCRTLNEITGCDLYFKCENLQRTGAFKFRGASNAVFSLTEEEAAHGVVTHSSGNHGAALASAAKTRSIPATIVMPTNSPAVKKAAVRGYGANLKFCAPTLQAREETAAAVLEETGGVLVHPYDDERIICGQGTAALELLEEVPGLDAILAPVGGAGLLSGTLLAAKLQCPKVRVYACEPEFADDAYRSWKAGAIQPVERTDTIADGLRTALGTKTFPIVQQYVDSVVLVSERRIVEATWLLLERAKSVVEPSGAVSLAALLGSDLACELAGSKVGVIISGGNLDVASFLETSSSLA